MAGQVQPGHANLRQGYGFGYSPFGLSPIGGTADPAVLRSWTFRARGIVRYPAAASSGDEAGMKTSTPPDQTALRAEIASADTLPALNGRFRRAVQAQGFSTYAVGFLPDWAVEGGTGTDAQEPFLLLDWPREWLELYARQGFATDDIVVAEAARTTEPFTWSEVQARHPGASAQIFAAAAEFGWGDGFVIPVHDPQGPPGERFGVASLAAARLDRFDALARAATVAVTLTAFARARTLRQTGAKAVGRPALSERERQGLALVAEGLGDAEIGERLGVTRATAHFHVERAKKRLGAATRAQAVAIALLQGLL